MFWIAKIAGSLLLPPGSLILLALPAAVLIWRWGGKAGALVLAGFAVLLYLVSIQPVADALLIPLEDAHPAGTEQAGRCAAIAVMGGGTGGRIGAAGETRLSRASVLRTLAAYRLWRGLHRPVILSGGPVWPDGASAGNEMAGLLESLGLPAPDLIAETGSRTTYDNGAYTSEIAQRRGWHTLCVVTSAVHLPRTLRVFRHFGIETVPIPTDYRAGSPPYGWESYLPRAASLAAAATAIHERVGLLYYRVRWGI